MRAADLPAPTTMTRSGGRLRQVGSQDFSGICACDGSLEDGSKGGADFGVVGGHRERNYPALE